MTETKPGAQKVIITCAITGGIHTPTMSAALPCTPDEIVQQSVAAAEAGAAILHLHARDPADGRPSPDPELFAQFLPRIKQQTDAVLNVTTGGGLNMTVEQRLAAPLRMRPEMCSLNMGSMNFGIFPLADRHTDWKHDWEEPYLRGTDDFIFRNTFRDIERIIRLLGDAHGTRFEHECYDVGHLYNLAHFVDRGLVKPPFFVQTIFGILGGIGADWDNLHFMRRTAGPAVRAGLRVVRAGGRPEPVSVRGAGRDDGRPCACGAGGQSVYRAGAAGGFQCRAGDEDTRHSGGAGAWHSDRRRGARDAWAEGRGCGGLLMTARRHGREQAPGREPRARRDRGTSWIGHDDAVDRHRVGRQDQLGEFHRKALQHRRDRLIRLHPVQPVHLAYALGGHQHTRTDPRCWRNTRGEIAGMMQLASGLERRQAGTGVPACDGLSVCLVKGGCGSRI